MCRARSAIRSRSLLIRRTTAIRRRSDATGWCRARTRRQSRSIWISQRSIACVADLHARGQVGAAVAEGADARVQRLLDHRRLLQHPGPEPFHVAEEVPAQAHSFRVPVGLPAPLVHHPPPAPRRIAASHPGILGLKPRPPQGLFRFAAISAKTSCRLHHGFTPGRRRGGYVARRGRRGASGRPGSRCTGPWSGRSTADSGSRRRAHTCTTSGRAGGRRRVARARVGIAVARPVGVGPVRGVATVEPLEYPRL